MPQLLKVLKLLKLVFLLKNYQNAFSSAVLPLAAINQFSIPLNSVSAYWDTWQIMVLAMINGIITSIILETIILLKTMKLAFAFKTALGMSLISMLIMEATMNIVDVAIMGGAYLSIEVIPVILFSGWIAAAPYNYYRLKKYEISCH